MERKIVEHLVSGKGFNEVCRALGVGRRRAATVREKARVYGYLDGRAQVPPYPQALFPDAVDGRCVKASQSDRLLQEKLEWIEDRLRAGWQPVTLWEELPIRVGRSSFYRFLHRHSLTRLGEETRRNVSQEIIHCPGEALIVDWGKLRDVTLPGTRKKQTLWAFVGIMGYSRYMMVHLVWSHDVPNTLASLENMFREIEGVPRRITSDNPKCFALEASKYEPLLNPAYERFASHYGTQIECLPPRTPELKGKVERMMPFVRRLYQAHGEVWQGIIESQSYINKKIAIANERIHGTTRRKPIDLFLEEKAALQPLAALGYEIEEFHEGKVRRDGHVRFRNKYYSVEESYIGENVVVIGNSQQVSIYYKGKLIETHNRVTDPNKTKSTKPNHLGPWAQTLEDNSYYRKMAARIGTDVEKVILKLLTQGNGFIDTRKIWGILSLDKKYSSNEINEACQKAISLESYSYRTILSFVKTASIQQDDEELKPEPKTAKFARPMTVYQQHLFN